MCKKYSPESIYSCYRAVAPAQVSDSKGANVAEDAWVGAVATAVIETVASADIACRRGRGLWEPHSSSSWGGGGGEGGNQFLIVWA